ncbi:hypothetical protein HK099_003084, partial [Clydaea vesicula]
NEIKDDEAPLFGEDELKSKNNDEGTDNEKIVEKLFLPKDVDKSYQANIELQDTEEDYFSDFSDVNSDSCYFVEEEDDEQQDSAKTANFSFVNQDYKNKLIKIKQSNEKKKELKVDDCELFPPNFTESSIPKCELKTNSENKKNKKLNFSGVDDFITKNATKNLKDTDALDENELEEKEIQQAIFLSLKTLEMENKKFQDTNNLTVRELSLNQLSDYGEDEDYQIALAIEQSLKEEQNFSLQRESTLVEFECRGKGKERAH